MKGRRLKSKTNFRNMTVHHWIVIWEDSKGLLGVASEFFLAFNASAMEYMGGLVLQPYFAGYSLQLPGYVVVGSVVPIVLEVCQIHEEDHMPLAKKG